MHQLIFRVLLLVLYENGGGKSLKCLVFNTRTHCLWLWLTYPILFYRVCNEELRSIVKQQLESPKETPHQTQAGNQIPTLCTKPVQPRKPLVSEWHSPNRAFPSEIALRSFRHRGLLCEDPMLPVVAVEAEKTLERHCSEVGRLIFIRNKFIGVL